MGGNNKPTSYLSKERKQDLAELAEAVASARCPGKTVEPDVIAAANDITISFGHYDGAYDGLLEHRAGRFHIYCNLDRTAGRDTPRARFTLAHELGHFYIDAHRNALASGLAPSHRSFCEYESKDLVEQEADCFAANLLMPAGRFLSSSRRQPAGLPTVLELARLFRTSITSTAIRYAALGVTPCVVIKWTPERYAWKWLSNEARESGYRRTIEATERMVAGSATAKAFAGELLPVKGYFETGTTAAAWFPSIPHGGWKNVILIEQAMPLGRFGVITFLYPHDGKFPWWDD
jgi:Zn-dependent peptidase ImmA (M78 family)